ncbi:uncharacterized protein LOC130503523 [Raphanus sativus]|uniref:Uncharacterized protein LOC130503523 n=1 Tax=Raphanus sativus TaxID=3726 RepID=A0A9W3CRQ0_RAPSA|nr:uncharacterized protein LOC130503523 [Raphanus sativus]
MASYKGKGILVEEDDDEPIQLQDQADEHLINEYSSSLIGKILNPKKHNVERLIVDMPRQWGMSEKITAYDLGNGRFLFNFDNEEDLKSVLEQDNESDDLLDAEMEEPVIGNELMLMEDDDLLGEELGPNEVSGQGCEG